MADDRTKISFLKPTQAGLRAYGRLPTLVEEVQAGKIFDDEDQPPILLSRFKYYFGAYVHNGHHRVVACILAGRDFLYPEEVKYLDWDNSNSYHEFNWDVGFITPFSVKTEARLADLTPFWQAVEQAKHLYRIQEPDCSDIWLRPRLEKFIRRNWWLYKCSKTVHTMEDLAILSMAGITSQVTDFKVRI